VESESSMYSASGIRLYKCLHNDLEDTIFIRQDKIKGDYADFDYKAYWKHWLHGNKYHE